MSAVSISCPYCAGRIRINMGVAPITSKRKGPLPHDPGQEVDDFIIDRVEERHLSYATIGELLRDRGVLTPHGKEYWHPQSVKRQYRQALERRVERGKK